MTEPNKGFVPGGQANQNNISEGIPATETVVRTEAEAIKEKYGLDKPYTDVKKIVIALISDINVKSVYRQINSKYIEPRHDNIGSSINSTRIIMGGSKELECYMPSILGIAANHQDFITRVKAYFDNMCIPVGPKGKELNVSFNYERFENYEKVRLEEEIIEKAYEDADKTDTRKLKKAIEVRVDALNRLESTKYQFGKPENLQDYIVYRHCLLYPHVAKDIAVIRFNPSIRFYIKDENRELARAKKNQIASNKAKRNFLDCLDSAKVFHSIFVVYCATHNINILANLQLEDSVKQRMIDDFATQEPEKFNALFMDRNITIRAFIEECIAKGELHRSDVNQNILTPEANFIGANIKEAIAFFMNPANADFKKSLELKLKF